jgi:hypothetical protein
MPFQYLIIGTLIAMALAYLGQRAVQTWRGHCSSGCGCKSTDAKNDAIVTVESLTILKR